MKPIKTKEAAIEFVQKNFTGTEDQKLCLDNCLLDPIGINMAIILHSVLQQGYFPNGIDEHEGFSIYKYSKE